MNNPTWQVPNKQLERLLRGNADDIQQLQSRLFAVGNGETPSTLLITSCNAGEGKTTSAAVMALSLCLQGFERVLLVDGVTHEPKLHELIDCPIGPGVSDVIRNDVTWQEVVVPSALANLSFLPAGSVPVSETAVYRSSRFGELVNELGQNFDCVIVDSPAYLENSACAYVAPHFQGVLLVIAAEATRSQIVSEVKTRIESVGGKLVGAILNRRRYYIPQFLYKHL